MIETYRGFVMAQETDSNGHMNVQFYTQKFDQASGQFLTRLGYSFKDLAGENLGFAYVESTIRYIKEVMEDQPVHICTEIVDLSSKVVTIRHEMYHSLTNEIASDCLMKWVIFDKKTRKAIPLPKQLTDHIQNALHAKK